MVFDGIQVKPLALLVVLRVCLMAQGFWAKESVLLGLFWRHKRIIQFQPHFHFHLGMILRLVLCLNLHGLGYWASRKKALSETLIKMITRKSMWSLRIAISLFLRRIALPFPRLWASYRVTKRWWQSNWGWERWTRFSRGLERWPRLWIRRRCSKRSKRILGIEENVGTLFS